MYTDTYVHANINPKLHRISKNQLIRMILHKGLQKKTRGFCRVSKKIHQFYFDQGNSKKNWTDLEMKVRRIKIKRR